MKLTEQEKYQAIADLIQCYSIKDTHDTCFGTGFYRWVTSNDLRSVIQKRMGLPRAFCQIRGLFDKLVADGLLVRECKSGQYVKYCTKTWFGHTQVGDYWIKDVTIKNR